MTMTMKDFVCIFLFSLIHFRLSCQDDAVLNETEDCPPLLNDKKQSLPGVLNYLAVVQAAVNDDAEFSQFKSNKSYQVVLEHVSDHLADRYFEEILSSCPDLVNSDVIEVMALHHQTGSGKFKRFQIGHLPAFEMSPTIMRYLKVFCDLRTRFGSLDGIHVVEIGVGYGGLAAVIMAFSKVASYTLVDLAPVEQLALKYLSLGFLSKRQLANVRAFVSGACLQSHPPPVDLLISNYALSELAPDLRSYYQRRFVMAASRGYLTWNLWGLAGDFSVTLAAAGKRPRCELEKPQDKSPILESMLITWPAHPLLPLGVAAAGRQQHLVFACMGRWANEPGGVYAGGDLRSSPEAMACSGGDLAALQGAQAVAAAIGRRFHVHTAQAPALLRWFDPGNCYNQDGADICSKTHGLPDAMIRIYDCGTPLVSVQDFQEMFASTDVLVVTTRCDLRRKIIFSTLSAAGHPHPWWWLSAKNWQYEDMPLPLDVCVLADSDDSGLSVRPISGWAAFWGFLRGRAGRSGTVYWAGGSKWLRNEAQLTLGQTFRQLAPWAPEPVGGGVSLPAMLFAASSPLTRPLATSGGNVSNREWNGCGTVLAWAGPLLASALEVIFRSSSGSGENISGGILSEITLPWVVGWDDGKLCPLDLAALRPRLAGHKHEEGEETVGCKQLERDYSAGVGGQLFPSAL